MYPIGSDCRGPWFMDVILSNPLGMDDTGQIWKWADVGSSQMPREAPAYPTLTGGKGDDQPAIPSKINHLQLFTWITDHLAWLSHYDTVYVFVDNRELPGTNCPDHWPYFAPWIKGRCEVIGYRQERTTAIYVPISQTTGLNEVHYTWADTFVLEALCTVYPTINFALMDSDCVPTALFEVADLVTLMTDQASREEAMQSYTVASAHDCQPAVLLMTESRAELNAGLVVVTGHVPAISPDVSMEPETNPDPAKNTSTAPADDSDSRAHKARRIAAPATSKSPSEWETELCRSRARLLATSAVPEDSADALHGDCSSRRCLDAKQEPLEWTHAWAMLGEWAGQVAFPIPAPHIGWPRHGHGRYLRPAFIGRTPPFLTWARPIFEQEALSPCQPSQPTFQFCVYLATNCSRVRRWTATIRCLLLSTHTKATKSTWDANCKRGKRRGLLHWCRPPWR